MLTAGKNRSVRFLLSPFCCFLLFLLLDMLAAIARKDYEDRRRRTTQGIAQAKERDKLKPKEERTYRGRPANDERNQAISAMLGRGSSWAEVCKATGASRSKLQRLVKAQQNAEA